MHSLEILGLILFLGMGCSRGERSNHSTIESTTESSSAVNDQIEQGPIEREPTDSNSPSLADADLRILFIGNSHTHSHDLPKLVSDLIEFRRPSLKTATESIAVGFLKQVDSDSAANRRLAAVHWDFVILQAQEISASGRFDYSTKEGVSFARRAQESGAKVFFFAEWGLQGDSKNGDHTDGVYRKMAEDAKVSLIPVTRVWSQALTRSSDLPLYSSDGNHQSRLGASLTALTIAAFLLNESPQEFVNYQDPVASQDQWKLFCESASAEWE